MSGLRVTTRGWTVLGALAVTLATIAPTLERLIGA